MIEAKINGKAANTNRFDSVTNEERLHGFRNILALYINFAGKSFQQQLAYKFEYFIGVFNGLLFIFIFTSLWQAIFESSPVAGTTGFTLQKITAYAIFAMIIRISMTQDDVSTIAKIRSGAISMDMIKPMNYFTMLLAECLGQTLFHWATRVFPIFMVCLLAFEISIPSSPWLWTMFSVVWLLGYMLQFMLNFIFAMIAFWTVETFSFKLMKYGLFTIFSGGIIPIDFFPEWLMPFINILPFQYILYLPTSIIIGHISGDIAINMIAIQFCWVIGMGFMCWKMWTSGSRKLVVQGG